MVEKSVGRSARNLVGGAARFQLLDDNGYVTVSVYTSTQCPGSLLR